MHPTITKCVKLAFTCDNNKMKSDSVVNTVFSILSAAIQSQFPDLLAIHDNNGYNNVLSLQRSSSSIFTFTTRPETVIHDQGTEFVGHHFQQMLRRNGYRTTYRSMKLKLQGYFRFRDSTSRGCHDGWGLAVTNNVSEANNTSGVVSLEVNLKLW